MQILLTRDELKSNWETCSCGNRAEMAQVCQGEYCDDDDSFNFVRYAYKVLVCPACRSLNVIRYWRLENDFEDDVRGSSGELISREYTRELLHTTYRQPMLAVPQPIVDIYHQAKSVLATSPRASFILCGAALEEICRSQGVSDIEKAVGGKERHLTLFAQLEKLIELRQLPDELRRILHGIRDLRNLGAHGSTDQQVNMESEDAEVLIGLLEFVLQRLYVDSARTVEAQRNLDRLVTRVKNLPNENKPGENPEAW